MVATGIELALQIASNRKVQDAAVSAFEAVYSRIFTPKNLTDVAATINVKPMNPDTQMIVDRLSAIEQQLHVMPNDIEIAMAFSALQAELRAGQKRLWLILVPLFVINFALLALIYFR